MLICLDAMERALREECEAVLLVSSDQDFTHLATRLRGYGLTVIGAGETKTPDRFSAAWMARRWGECEDLRRVRRRSAEVRFSNWVFGSSSFSFFSSGSLSLIRVTLLFAVWFDALVASLHACVGSDVESPALRRASRCAADLFGFIHEPRPVRDDPVRFRGTL
jgi:hypothetical protein